MSLLWVSRLRNWVDLYSVTWSTKGPTYVSYTVFHDPVGRSSERISDDRPTGSWNTVQETYIGPFVDCDGSPQCLSLRIEHCLFGGLSSSCLFCNMWIRNRDLKRKGLPLLHLEKKKKTRFMRVWLLSVMLVLLLWWWKEQSLRWKKKWRFQSCNVRRIGWPLRA